MELTRSLTTLALALLNCFGVSFLGLKEFRTSLRGCYASLWDYAYTLETTLTVNCFWGSNWFSMTPTLTQSQVCHAVHHSMLQNWALREAAQLHLHTLFIVSFHAGSGQSRDPKPCCKQLALKNQRHSYQRNAKPSRGRGRGAGGTSMQISR